MFSPQSVWRCLDPYPAAFLRCPCPFLLAEPRPHLTCKRFGALRSRHHSPLRCSHRGRVPLAFFHHTCLQPLAYQLSYPAGTDPPCDQPPQQLLIDGGKEAFAIDQRPPIRSIRVVL
jgi:hypothetical protein